jgi:predicted DNA binding protein
MSTPNFINKIDTQGIPVSEFLNNITEHQLKILTLAHATGYYKIPRNVKLADIANEFGVARHSIEKTLRRAENKIMNILAPILNYEFSTNLEKIPKWFNEFHNLKSEIY